jgi:hypothetical protein
LIEKGKEVDSLNMFLITSKSPLSKESLNTPNITLLKVSSAYPDGRPDANTSNSAFALSPDDDDDDELSPEARDALCSSYRLRK